jgi:hypothetical protein
MVTPLALCDKYIGKKEFHFFQKKKVETLAFASKG